MMLTVFKNGGNLNFLETVIKIKSFSFQHLISKFVEIFSSWAYDEPLFAQSQ